MRSISELPRVSQPHTRVNYIHIHTQYIYIYIYVCVCVYMSNTISTVWNWGILIRQFMVHDLCTWDPVVPRFGHEKDPEEMTGTFLVDKEIMSLIPDFNQRPKPMMMVSNIGKSSPISWPNYSGGGKYCNLPRCGWNMLKPCHKVHIWEWFIAPIKMVMTAGWFSIVLST